MKCRQINDYRTDPVKKWLLLLVFISGIRACDAQNDSDVLKSRGRQDVVFLVEHTKEIFDIDDISRANPSGVMGLMTTEMDSSRWLILGKTLTNLTYLRVKVLTNTLAPDLFAKIAAFQGLRFLHLKCEEAHEVPPDILLLTNLPRLQNLVLNVPKVTNLNSSIYGIETLEELVLKAQCDLPDGISRLKRLRVLVCLGKLTNPERRFSLDLRQSSIEHLEILNMPGLNKSLSDLPPGLLELSVVGCELREVPRKWLEMPKLQYLCLNKNGIQQFPNDLSKLPSLTLLQMEYTA
jgi:Leucine-rich repeat (LRR) protein